MFNRLRLRIGILCGLLLVGNLGCTDTSGPAMVSGKVKFGNHEFKHWVIHIVPKTPGIGMSAPLESDGTFRLGTRLDPNEPYVAFFSPPEDSFDEKGHKVPTPPPEPPIPKKYASQESTDLVIDVKPGKNAFELELKP
jgi:hypothetical protein